MLGQFEIHQGVFLLRCFFGQCLSKIEGYYVCFVVALLKFSFGCWF